MARAATGSALLRASAAIGVIAYLRERPVSPPVLQRRLQMDDRAFAVMTTALRALNVLVKDRRGRLGLSEQARRHLLEGEPTYLGDYLGILDAGDYGRQVARALRMNEIAGRFHRGPLFVFRRGRASSMDDPIRAKALTLALAGRARLTAPALAAAVKLRTGGTLADVGCGSGHYAIALLKRFHKLRAVLVDHPAVINVAKEFVARERLATRCDFLAADMLSDRLPAADTILLSNVLHDWDIRDCRRLVARCGRALPVGGRLLVHETFLDDDLGGPLAAALHSICLFLVTTGRLYSREEIADWMQAANLRPRAGITPTANGYAVLEAVRHQKPTNAV